MRAASALAIATLNRQVAAGSVRTCAGVQVAEALGGGLVRDDGQLLYPVRQDIAVLLPEAAIVLTPPFEAPRASGTST